MPIKEIDVGNMHFSAGKEKVTDKVYVDQNDNVNIYIQDVPGDKKTAIDF